MTQPNTLLAEFLTSGVSVVCANIVTLPLGALVPRSSPPSPALAGQGSQPSPLSAVPYNFIMIKVAGTADVLKVRLQLQRASFASKSAAPGLVCVVPGRLLTWHPSCCVDAALHIIGGCACSCRLQQASPLCARRDSWLCTLALSRPSQEGSCMEVHMQQNCNVVFMALVILRVQCLAVACVDGVASHLPVTLWATCVSWSRGWHCRTDEYA